MVSLRKDDRVKNKFTGEEGIVVNALDSDRIVVKFFGGYETVVIAESSLMAIGR